jgi:hypothetical protein
MVPSDIVASLVSILTTLDFHPQQDRLAFVEMLGRGLRLKWQPRSVFHAFHFDVHAVADASAVAAARG